MTTTITIACGNCFSRFAGKPEYIGRRIKCPKCGEVFRVAEDAGASLGLAESVASQTSLVSPEATEPDKMDPYFDEWNVPDDFEYKVQDLVDESQTKCKFCQAELKPDQVLCMKCGYNRQLDQMMETKRGIDAVFEDNERTVPRGHIGFGTFSLPILPTAICGGVVLLLGLVLLLIAPPVFALLCFLGGFILTTVGHFWVIVVAFREDVWQGVLAWFIPIYWWVYVFSRWDETWIGFAIWGAGCLLLFFGMGVFLTMTPDDTAALLQHALPNANA